MNIVIDYASLDDDEKEVNAVAISYKIDGAEKRCWLEKVRRLGHWIFCEDNYNMRHWYECSACEKTLKDFQEKSDFCPHCGAKMDESEENNDKT